MGYLNIKPVVPGGPGRAMAPHILADKLSLSQPWGADYAHHITKGHLILKENFQLNQQD